MEPILFKAKILWSQIDANAHLRHSAYADFAAQARMEVLEKCGLDAGALYKLQLGPVLFREELKYLKEIRLGDSVQVSCAMTRCRRDGAKWSFRHHIYNQAGTLSAVVDVDGAWIDMARRKVAGLPAAFLDKMMEQVTLSPDFVWEEKITVKA